MKSITMAWVGVGLFCAVGALAGFQTGKSSAVAPAEESESTGRTGVLPAARTRSLQAGGKRSERLESGELMAKLQVALGAEDRKEWNRLSEQIGILNRDELLQVLANLAEIENERVRFALMWPVFSSLAKVDPPQALEEAMKLSSRPERSHLMGVALGEWTKVNPEAALEKARALGSEQSGGRQNYLWAVFQSWGRLDFETAMRVGNSLGDRSECKQAIRGLAGVVGADQTLRQRLFEFGAQVEDASLGREFLRDGVQLWAQLEGNREELGELIDGQNLEAEFKSQLLRAVAEGAGDRDPRQTADWLLERSTPESLSLDLQTAVSTWAQRQPEACGRWLEERMKGPEADEAVASYAQTVARRDSGEGLSWSVRILDRELRNRSLTQVVRLMGPIPAERLRQELEAAGLEEGMVAQLLKVRER